MAWLTVSSERFQALMRRLASRAAPPEPWDPVADAEKRTSQHKRADTSTTLEGTAQAAPNVGAMASPASTDGVKQAAPQTAAEQRRLIELRRASADKRAEEVKQTQAALQALNAKKAAEAKKNAQATTAEAGAKSARATTVPETRTAVDVKAERNAAVPKEAKDPAHARSAEAKANEQRRRTQQTMRSRDAAAAARGTQVDQATPPAAAKSADEPKQALASHPSDKTQQAEPRKQSDTRSTTAAASTPPAQSASPPQPGAAMSGDTTPALAAMPRGGGHQRHTGRSPSRCEGAGNAVDLPGWYVVKKGDTLWSIAHRFYGAGQRYKRIFAANRRRVHSPHWIYPCQKLRLTRPAHRA
jgi:nucleoid-associated protein YgaU